MAWPAPVMDTRVYTHVLFNQLEGRSNGSGSSLRWDGEGWVGTDMNRLWVKSEGFVNGSTVSDGDHGASVRKRFERQLDVFRQHPDVYLCSTDYHRTNGDGNIRLTRRWPTDYDVVRTDPSCILRVCKASIMARREVLDAVPPYREFFDLLGGEDIDWLYRLVERHPARHLPEVLYSYRVHYSAAKKGRVSHTRYYAMEIVEQLRRQRLSSGMDWLEAGDHEGLRLMIAELERPFLEDPSYVCRLRANDMIRFGKPFAAGPASLMPVVPSVATPRVDTASPSTSDGVRFFV